MQKEVVKVIVDFDKVVAKSSQRTTEIRKINGGGLLTFKGLVANVGAESAVRSSVSECGLVKTTEIGLTEASMLELYVVLQSYIEDVLKEGVVVATPKKSKSNN